MQVRRRSEQRIDDALVPLPGSEVEGGGAVVGPHVHRRAAREEEAHDALVAVPRRPVQRVPGEAREAPLLRIEQRRAVRYQPLAECQVALPRGPEQASTVPVSLAHIVDATLHEIREERTVPVARSLNF